MRTTICESGESKEWIIRSIEREASTALVVIEGGPGNEHLEGGGGNDSIDGDSGNDKIDGRCGDDDDKIEGRKEDELIVDLAEMLTL